MNLTESVDRATADLLAHTEQVARDHGLVPPPMVWAFDPERVDPLIGCGRTRPFYKGRDTVHAIERLGLFPGAYAAPLVMVSWEQADLCSALESDDLQSGPSIVTVVANNRGGHQVTMHPFQFRVLGSLPSGQLGLAIDWEPDIDLGSADVPVPIAYLLGHWSTYAKRHQAAEHPDGDTRRVVSGLRDEGYGIDLRHEATRSQRPACAGAPPVPGQRGRPPPPAPPGDLRGRGGAVRSGSPRRPPAGRSPPEAGGPGRSARRVLHLAPLPPAGSGQAVRRGEPPASPWCDTGASRATRARGSVPRRFSARGPTHQMKQREPAHAGLALRTRRRRSSALRRSCGS